MSLFFMSVCPASFLPFFFYLPLQFCFIFRPHLVFLRLLVGRSQYCKVLPELLQKLLSVDMFRKRVLRLLSCSVAALKVSDLKPRQSIIQQTAVDMVLVSSAQAQKSIVVLPFQRGWRGYSGARTCEGPVIQQSAERL